MNHLTKNTFYPPIKTTSSVNSFTIKIIELILNTSVSIHVMLYDTDDKFITAKNFVIDGDAYKAWGSDDNYITNYVKQALQNESLY